VVLRNITDEGIRQIDKYSTRPALDRKYCEQAVALIIKKIDANLESFGAMYPAPASQNLIYPLIENVEWTTSFWPGMLWLAYEITGMEKYRHAATGHLKSFQRRIEEKICTQTHDLGFLYTLSCVAAYRLTGNRDAGEIALKASNLLTERYYEKAGIIQAWGDLEDPEQRGRMIIDCCMNLPLLHWTSRETGNPHYAEIAASHARQAANYMIRDDASTYHTYYMDIVTGAPRFGKTAQGYADDSCWARGQAWGIYGFALSYLYTGDWRFIELAKKLTHYFLNRLPEDSVCYWDLVFTSGTEERDSSAAAIAACGLLEISRRLPLCDPHKVIYENAALMMVQSLTENYTTRGLASNGILTQAVYSKPACEGVNECVIWGDYFYFEALTRLLKDWKPYW
jgi:unsaturated chondroitin disaccharide hydrolase